jgi:hypothetical protein
LCSGHRVAHTAHCKLIQHEYAVCGACHTMASAHCKLTACLHQKSP